MLCYSNQSINSHSSEFHPIKVIWNTVVERKELPRDNYLHFDKSLKNTTMQELQHASILFPGTITNPKYITNTKPIKEWKHEQYSFI